MFIFWGIFIPTQVLFWKTARFVFLLPITDTDKITGDFTFLHLKKV